MTSKAATYFKLHPDYVFITRFLLCFGLLYFFFPFYRGLTGEGGKIYSAFLATHVNFIRGFSEFLTVSARLLLQAFQYTVNQNNYHTLRIEHSRGVIVNPSCLGWGVMSFWVAFVIAHVNSVKFKLKWLVVGIGSIVLLNIIRVAAIALANHHNWQLITSLDHHLIFNVVSYSFIFLFTVLFVKTQKKYERISFGKGQQSHTFSPV